LTVYPIPFQTVSTGPQMAEYIHSGAVDVAIGGLLTEAFLVSRVDADVKVIGQLQTSNVGEIIAGNKLIQETGLTESSPLESKVRALVGKKIGVVAPTGQTGSFVTYLFRRYGLNINTQATLVSLGANIPGALGALKTGRVEALSFFAPVGEAAQVQGVGQIWITPVRGDVPEMDNQLNSVFYAKASLVQAKPNTIRALVRAIAMALTRALAFIQKYPDQAAKIFQKYMHLDDATTQLLASTIMSSYPASPIVDQQGYEVSTTYDIKAGLISAAPPFQKLVDVQTATQALQGFNPVV
jgi:NitT/TauT family transport system substrate-binding protein